VAPKSKDPKLIIRAIKFELVQPICPRYINITDGRTDGWTTYYSNTSLALCASRSKKCLQRGSMLLAMSESDLMWREWGEAREASMDDLLKR